MFAIKVFGKIRDGLSHDAAHFFARSIMSEGSAKHLTILQGEKVVGRYIRNSFGGVKFVEVVA